MRVHHSVINRSTANSHRRDGGRFTSTYNQDLSIKQVSGSKVIHTAFKLLRLVGSILFLIFLLWLLNNYKQT